MSNSQQIVDEIRSFLQSADQTLTDSVKQLATAYARACQEVSARLRRCGEFLQQGLRSEAIHLAEAEPNLLDELATLDFPERKLWEEVCLSYSLPSPGRLNFEAAEALNEAYAESLPLDGLLRKHRLLALMRAPVAQRLSLLRTIAGRDAGNAVWSEDIKTFEKVRLAEIEVEIRQAAAKEDVQRVTRLSQEVSQNKWLCPPPPSLVRQVESTANRFEQRKLRQLAERLEEQLREAHSALDLASGRQLRTRWEELIKKVDLPLGDPIYERVNPALDWLRKEDRRDVQRRKFEMVLSRLENTLAQSQDRERIVSDFEALREVGEEIPPEVAERYRARLESMDRAVRRRRVVIAAATAAAVLLVAGLIAFWVIESRQTGRAHEYAEQIARMLDNGDLPSAQALYERVAAQEPGLVKREELTSLRARLQAEDAKEQQRSALLRKEMREAEVASSEDNRKAALARAKSHALRAEERDLIRQLENKIQEESTRTQAEREAALQPRLIKAREHLAEFESAVRDAYDSRRVSELRQPLQTELNELKDEAERVPGPLREQVEQLARRFAAAEASIDMQTRQSELIDRLTRALQSDQGVDAYLAAMDDYIRSFPETPRSRAFKDVKQERPLWEQLFKWHALFGPYAGKPFALTTAQARSQLEPYHDFLKDYPAPIDGARIQDYVRCLEALAEQDAGAKGTAAARLRDLFGALYIKGLWFLELPNEKVYYLAQDPTKDLESAKKKAGYLNVKYLVGFDASDKPKLIKYEDIQKSGQAPQSAIAAEADRLLATVRVETWDETLQKLAAQIQNKQDMDPILRLSLLKAVLGHAAKGSYPLALELQDFQRILNGPQIDLTVPWINPDRDCSAERKLARDLFPKLPALEPLLKTAVERRRRLAAAVAESNVKPFGWLVQTKGKWECRSRASLDEPGELCVIMPGGTAEFGVIGRVESGKAILEPGNSRLHAEGRLVFIRKPRTS
jgi:hypothetical protein